MDLRAKNANLHAASVVGDTVGGLFKDTSSVTMTNAAAKYAIGGVLFAVALRPHDRQARRTLPRAR